jgi:hypothetical protein
MLGQVFPSVSKEHNAFIVRVHVQASWTSAFKDKGNNVYLKHYTLTQHHIPEDLKTPELFYLKYRRDLNLCLVRRMMLQHIL